MVLSTFVGLTPPFSIPVPAAADLGGEGIANCPQVRQSQIQRRSCRQSSLSLRGTNFNCVRCMMHPLASNAGKRSPERVRASPSSRLSATSVPLAS